MTLTSTLSFTFVKSQKEQDLALVWLKTCPHSSSACVRSTDALNAKNDGCVPQPRQINFRSPHFQENRLARREVGSTSAKEAGCTSATEVRSTSAKEVDSTFAKDVGSTSAKEVGSTSAKRASSSCPRLLSSSASLHCISSIRVQPLPGKLGKNKTVRTRFWSWLSRETLSIL